MQTGMTRIGQHGMTEMAFAYGIRLLDYVRALARHGLPVDQSGKSLAVLSGRGTIKTTPAEKI